jgi:hypothetical protein
MPRMEHPDEADLSINEVLPGDVIAYIASLVEQNQPNGSLASFIAVCKEWCSIGRGATKRLVICEQFHGIDARNRLKDGLDLFPNAESLRFRFVSLPREIRPPEGSQPAMTFEQNAGSLDLQFLRVKHL